MVWDEPDLLHNVKRVNPWLVELVSTMAAGHGHGLSPFSPPRKRPRLPHPTEFPYGQLPMGTLVTNPLSPSSPLCCLPDNIPAGVQGARHARFELPKLQPFDFKLLDYAGQFPRLLTTYPLQNPSCDALSCSLKTGSSSPHKVKKSNEAKTPMFLLFGQPILTAEQISQSHSVDMEGNSSDGNQENTANVSNGSGSAVIQNFPLEASSDGEFPRFKEQTPYLGAETGQCKVFVESENVGRTLDLAMLRSYEELYRKLSGMFGMERSEMSSNVLYNDACGNAKHIGDEPFR